MFILIGAVHFKSVIAYCNKYMWPYQ